MPQVYRVSLVVMVFASEVKRGSPQPFVELRSFLFLDRIPTPLEEVRIKAALRLSIDEVMHKFLPHIFLTDKQDYNMISRETAKPISLKSLTRMTKIQIEGFEVEPMDIDEVLNEPIYWRELNGRIEHGLFSQDTRNVVMQGRKRLQLNTNYIYRYVAFYLEDGSIKRDYDEFEIKDVVKQRVILESQQKRLYGKMYNVLGRMRSDVSELETLTAQLERISDKLNRGRI